MSNIKFHELLQIGSQSVHTLQSLFQVILKCNNNFGEEIHMRQHSSPYEFPLLVSGNLYLLFTYLFTGILSHFEC